MASQPNARAKSQSHTDLLDRIDQLNGKVAYWQNEARLKDQVMAEILRRDHILSMGVIAIERALQP